MLCHLPKSIGVRNRRCASARRRARILTTAAKSATRATHATAAVAPGVEHRGRAERSRVAGRAACITLEAAEIVHADLVVRLVAVI